MPENEGMAADEAPPPPIGSVPARPPLGPKAVNRRKAAREGNVRRQPLGLGSALPWLGLALFVGCLSGLLREKWPGNSPGRPKIFPGGVIVVIDPGHGGMDSGAVAQGVVEKDLNLDVGLRIARILRSRGLTVKLTREDDHFVPLEARVQMTNALAGAIFVSIHFNDAQGGGRATTRASGIETYYTGSKLLTPGRSGLWATLFGRAKPAPNLAPAEAIQNGQALAACIQHALIAGTGAADRGIKEASLYVTHRVRGPAVLVEGGFVSHPQEALLLQDRGYRQKIADAIAAGIFEYLQEPKPGGGNGAGALRA